MIIGIATFSLDGMLKELYQIIWLLNKDRYNTMLKGEPNEFLKIHILLIVIQPIKLILSCIELIQVSQWDIVLRENILDILPFNECDNVFILLFDNLLDLFSIVFDVSFHGIFESRKLFLFLSLDLVFLLLNQLSVLCYLAKLVIQSILLSLKEFLSVLLPLFFILLCLPLISLFLVLTL